ncbi:hypothetical protein DFJ58DRAFT_839246 [Suillus subalutaceus]|uniref:uncharacterized protein n=1 Tax=Suillus subalutaceus TaxID=48586 RepID=UPI001B8772DF|nr:uncharacterized protein DFJ58DRAFT_839246 [Suillus subalutaceus]KAG1862707.1 hypothetical protein DFJ58DRAFT_839246 [Suillus subalutaceus]
MASERPPNAQWNDNEIFAFLDHLISEKAKVAEGGFKNNVFNQAARVITQFTTHGPTKTGGHCKGKWQYVSKISTAPLTDITTDLDATGITSSGVNIVGGAAETQWIQFLESNSNKAMRSFRNSRWKFFPKMEEILPNGSGAMCAAAYNLAPLAAQSPAVVTSASIMASQSAPSTASTEVGSNAIGLAICVPPPHNIPVSPAHADGFGWDMVMSALPSANIGIYQPPAPENVRTLTCSSLVTPPNPPMSHIDSASSEKKPKLLAHGGSTMSHVASQCNSKARQYCRRLYSLSTSMTNTDESQVADERSQALAIMQDDEEITPEDKVTLMIVFGRSPSTCTTYVSSRPENRLPYLQSVIHQALRGDFGAL